MVTSGAVFQRLMDKAMERLQPKCCLVYIDDVTVFFKNIDNHIRDIGRVLDQLIQHNLKINLKKCKFAKQEIHMLGHIADATSIRINPKKVQRIQDMLAPVNCTGVKSFLGMTGFY